MVDHRLCGCGCGEAVTKRFVSGHNSRVRHPFSGRHHSDETRVKIRAARARQTNVRGGDRRDPRPLTERFDEKVMPITESGCEVWTGGTGQKGYGVFWVGTHLMPAHRFAYERWVGPIPEGREIDHLCRVRSCVNPRHLEAVSHVENLRRARVAT